MSWAIGYDSSWHRDIGYGVPAYCDYPTCQHTIDRGLGYVCGGEPYGGDHGCGLYFCAKHQVGTHQRCTRCTNRKAAFDAKPDHPRWMHHKLTDESWARWREAHPEETQELHRAMDAVDPSGPPRESGLRA